MHCSVHYIVYSPIHTADADETKLFCRVGVSGVNTIRDDCRRIWSTVWKLTKQTQQRLITPFLTDIDNFFNNDVIMSSLLKKVSNIYQNSRSQTALEFVWSWSVSKLWTEFVGSRRELVANCVHTADADATKQFRRVGVGGVYWA